MCVWGGGGADMVPGKCYFVVVILTCFKQLKVTFQTI